LLDKEHMTDGTLVSDWFIDLNWFKENNRSIAPLLLDRLCPDCRKQYGSQKGEMSPEELLKVISDCCATKPVFLRSDLPLLERVFRLFLTNGNTRLNTGEIVEQLNAKTGSEGLSVSTMTINRLLTNDRYYGLSSL